MFTGNSVPMGALTLPVTVRFIAVTIFLRNNERNYLATYPDEHFTRRSLGFRSFLNSNDEVWGLKKVR